jgi:hypothetical protein
MEWNGMKWGSVCCGCCALLVCLVKRDFGGSGGWVYSNYKRSPMAGTCVVGQDVWESPTPKAGCCWVVLCLPPRSRGVEVVGK